MRRLSPNLVSLVLAALSLYSTPSVPAAGTKIVLVIYSYNRLNPGNFEFDRGLRAALTSDTTDQSVRISSEFLDTPEFSGAAYEDLEVAYLRGKYAGSPPVAIVTVADGALAFVVRHRAQLFPGVPVVHAGVATATLQTLRPLSDDIVGIPTDYDFAGTIRQALRWHPKAKHLVVVTGASYVDHEKESELRRVAPLSAGQVGVDFWSGLPTMDLQKRLASLGLDTVVFTIGYFQDGDGKQFSPRDAAAIIARASSAPVYGPVDTFIGTGVVGGVMPDYEKTGSQTGEAAKRLLAGVAPLALHLPDETPSTTHIDWQQAQRWKISDKLIPADAIVHFKPPSMWQAYRTEVLAALAVFVLQSVLIAALYIEHRRRARAEMNTQILNTELAHASRLAVAGELTASIAHEINQPLGAIQTSADAANWIFQAGEDHREDRRKDLFGIVTRIRRDTLRVSDVIRRLRTLLAKSEPERRAFDASEAMADVAMILRPEAERRGIQLNAHSATAAVYIVGDQTQIQQVLINLVINAMDAVANLPANRRQIEVMMQHDDRNVLITVQDRGHGIPLENLPKLFDAFFSTKERGMGIGLSIARTIVETYGGRIWGQNRDFGGAAFHVEMPLQNAGELNGRAT
jgi:signal transduction histidine kinase